MFQWCMGLEDVFKLVVSIPGMADAFVKLSVSVVVESHVGLEGRPLA